MVIPSVTIVILNHNRRDDTLACLASLAAIEYPHYQIVVVDNASSDSSIATFRAVYPDLPIIENKTNLGFAAGNNIGIRYALESASDYVLLLNNDTEVAPDFLDQLIMPCLADETIGVVGPKIYYYDQPRTLWSVGGMIDWQRGQTRMRGLDMPDQGQFDTQVDIDFASGCALLIRRTVLEKAGLLDERFGMYYEETEWCVRIVRAGWRITYVPRSCIWHKIKPTAQDRSPSITYYMTRNRLLFLRLTHAPLCAWLHALLVQDLRTWLSWRFRRRWQFRTAQRTALCNAWRDFLFNRFGMVT